MTNTTEQACKRPGCGNQFPAWTHPNGVVKVYCSKECRRTHYNEVGRAVRADMRERLKG